MNNDDPNDISTMENEDKCPSSGVEENNNINENVSNYSGNNNDMHYDDDDDDDDDDIDMDPDFQYFEEMPRCAEVNFRCRDFSAMNEFGEGTSSGLTGNVFYYFRPGDFPVAPEWSHGSQDQLSIKGWGTENASGSDQRSIVPGAGQENSNEIGYNPPYSNMQAWDDHEFRNPVSDQFECGIFEEMMEWQEGECRGFPTNDLNNGTEELKKFANLQEMADYLESIILMLAIYLWCDQTIASNQEREKEALEKKNSGKKNGKDDDSENPV